MHVVQEIFAEVSTLLIYFFSAKPVHMWQCAKLAFPFKWLYL